MKSNKIQYKRGDIINFRGENYILLEFINEYNNHKEQEWLTLCGMEKQYLLYCLQRKTMRQLHDKTQIEIEEYWKWEWLTREA